MDQPLARQGLLVISENQPRQKSIFKSPLVYSSLLILVVAAYVGWILLSRRQSNRAYEQQAEQAQAKKQRESDQAAVAQLGGSDLAIQMLYATPRIHRGETAQVCFGVANAKTETNLRGISAMDPDRKSTRLNSSHSQISYAVFCLKKKK